MTESNVNPQHKRFNGAVWYEKAQGDVLTLVGAGGIGSWLSLYLYSSGAEIFLYDSDLFETHNSSGQLFFHKDVTKPKPEAVKNLCKAVRTSESSFRNINEHFKEDSMVCKRMFVGTDSFSSRKLCFERWKQVHGNDPEAIYIDGRLSFSKIQIFTVRGGTPEVEGYLNTVFNDDDFPEAECALKQNTAIAAKIGTFMWDKYVNHLTNLQAGEQIGNPNLVVADVSFYFEYDSTSGRGRKCKTYEDYGNVFDRPKLQD